MTGAMIVGMGLPGSGKSSVFAALTDQLIRSGTHAKYYREPEENEWPLAVTGRDEVGHITALTWFRSQRVPGLYKASNDRDGGQIALVDSYYDKLVSDYFDLPGFQWLMKADDPYRTAYRQIVALDRKLLPEANCIVTFKVSAERWKNLVMSRGRALDRAAGLLDTHATQEAFVETSEAYCRNRRIPHVQFDNVQETALASAEALHQALIDVGVLK